MKLTSRLLFLFIFASADDFSRGPRPRPDSPKSDCPKWGTEIGGYCLWKGSHFPVKREEADELCRRSGGHVFLPVEKPRNLLLQKIYRSSGLSFRSPIWMNLEQVGFFKKRFKKGSRKCKTLPKLKTDQTPRPPSWIHKYSNALFYKSRMSGYMKNVLYYPDGKNIRFYLVRKCDIAYPICTTKKIPSASGLKITTTTTMKTKTTTTTTSTTTSTTTTTTTTTTSTTTSFDDIASTYIDHFTATYTSPWAAPEQVSVRIQDGFHSASDYSSG